MKEFFNAIARWEKVFSKGCRVVIWGDGSGHVEGASNHWRPVFAFENIEEFINSRPEDFYPTLRAADTSAIELLEGIKICLESKTAMDEDAVVEQIAAILKTAGRS